VPLADRLILFPTTFAIGCSGAERHGLPFANGELEIWTAASRSTYLQASADVYVLRFYGNADRAERWVASEANEWGSRAVEVWGVNYPGYGGSSGPASLRRMAAAGLVAFDALRAKTAGKPVIVSGTSIGTTVALHIAAQRSVNGLVLHNPPALRQVILRGFGWWNLWLIAAPVALQIPPELDSIANAKRIHIRAAFLLADRDEIVAPKFQQLVVNAYAGEKQLIKLPGAFHNSPIEEASAADVYKAYDWLLHP
jgi:pimeloyl-ACP methyl ester carboxylesterase